MYVYKYNRILRKLKFGDFRCLSQKLLPADEYTDTPNYPPILDMSLEARKLRERETLHRKIQNLNTVEEKQIALNMPRYYGWKCVMFPEDKIPYNALPMVKCYTRSHFIQMEKLPDVYNNTSDTADKIVKEIKSFIEDSIITEHLGAEKQFTPLLEKPEVEQKENAITKCIIRQINRIIINNVVDDAQHLSMAQVDYEPRHEAFWFVGGTNVPGSVLKWRRKYPWLRDRLDEPVDRAVQYIGKPLVTIRSHDPLPPIVPYSEADNTEFKVDKFTYRPEKVGYFNEFRHGTNIPGFWPGDHEEFGLMSIHGRGHISSRKTSFGPEDNIEALHCQALKASFGWLLAQANYQGFTTYNDLTYPLATQTVITNGQLWSLYAYQLNTIVMHNEQMDVNPKHNVCFGTEPIKLYDTIENEQVKGLNDNVLKMLVQFYLNAPTKRNHELKPYLGEEEKFVADIEDDNKRCWLEDRYKHLVSNRPKHDLLPEYYLWEKIYKIKHNTRFFEAKRRPFELGINPFKRKLNEHLPPYIPKCFRLNPKTRVRFEKTYYPDV